MEIQIYVIIGIQESSGHIPNNTLVIDVLNALRLPRRFDLGISVHPFRPLLGQVIKGLDLFPSRSIVHWNSFHRPLIYQLVHRLSRGQ